MKPHPVYYTKVWENVSDFISETVWNNRKPWITESEYAEAKGLVSKGDFILVSTYRTLTGFFTMPFVTNHIIYYHGDDKIIHSLKGGVQWDTLQWLCSYYDGFIVIRNKNYTHKTKDLVDKYMTELVGSPFNYPFCPKIKAFYCSQLVNEALNKAELDSDLPLFNKKNKWITRYLPFLQAVFPKEFLQSGEYDIVYNSGIYEVKDKKISLKKPFYGRIFKMSTEKL